MDTIAETDKKIKEGTILYSSWGYDQTNIDWYKVVRANEKTAWVVRLRAKKTYDGHMHGASEPTDEQFGEVIRRKIKNYGYDYINIDSYASAYVWDGRPKGFSEWA